MKNIAFLLLIALGLSACNKTEKTEAPAEFDRDAILSLNLSAAPNKKTNENLSYAHLIDSLGYKRFAIFYGIEFRPWIPKGVDHVPDSIAIIDQFGIGPNFLYGRDTLKQRFQIGGTNVINTWRDPVELGYFIWWYDVILRIAIDSAGNPMHCLYDFPHGYIDGVDHFDTIGYIPNQKMQESSLKIRTAFEAKDYNECYRLLENVFVFEQTSGPEYMELVRQGRN
ncbi:MAG: hypothetical protein RRX93_07885 [Bacteroidales bacterium]